ncbi:hypothetical protein S245_069883, partial [Arachis hypogaea]
LVRLIKGLIFHTQNTRIQLSKSHTLYRHISSPPLSCSVTTPRPTPSSHPTTTTLHRHRPLIPQRHLSPTLLLNTAPSKASPTTLRLRGILTQPSGFPTLFRRVAPPTTRLLILLITFMATKQFLLLKEDLYKNPALVAVVLVAAGACLY